MGTSHQLIVASKSVFSQEFGVEPWIMALFRESDKRVFQRKRSDAIGWAVANSDDEEIETAYIYQNTIKSIKHRLDIMGFTLKRIETDFSPLIEGHITNIENNRARRHDLPTDVNMLRNTTFDAWLTGFKLLFNNQFENIEDLPENISIETRHLWTEGLDSFPCNDYFSYLRIYLEACKSDNDLVYLDITYLVQNDFYFEDDTVCDNALQTLNQEFASNGYVQKSV